MVQSAAQFLVTDVVIMGIFVIAAVAFALRSPCAWRSARWCLAGQALIVVRAVAMTRSTGCADRRMPQPQQHCQGEAPTQLVVRRE